MKIENFTLCLCTPPAEWRKVLPDNLFRDTDVPFNYYVDLVVDHDGKPLVEFDEPKRFVPSFDSKLKDHLLILQYTGEHPETAIPITLVASVNLKTKEVKVSGWGFTCANLAVEIP